MCVNNYTGWTRVFAQTRQEITILILIRLQTSAIATKQDLKPGVFTELWGDLT